MSSGGRKRPVFVTVELRREDAELWRDWQYPAMTDAAKRVVAACAKALKEAKR